MTVVSIRDFRSNQGKYLGLAAKGESVILTSRAGSFKIVPVSEDDSLISKKEFFARVNQARKDIAEGKGFAVNGKEALASLLESIQMYTLTFAPQALEDLAKLKKSEPTAFKKAGKLLGELQDHPKTGTGRPEA